MPTNATDSNIFNPCSSTHRPYGDRVDGLRLRAGWHNTGLETYGEQRFSLEGRQSGDDGDGKTTAWNEIITFKADGMVGVGTVDPIASMHVVGNQMLEGKLFLAPQKPRFDLGPNEELNYHSQHCSINKLHTDLYNKSIGKTRVPGMCPFSNFTVNVHDNGTLSLYDAVSNEVRLQSFVPIRLLPSILILMTNMT